MYDVNYKILNGIKDNNNLPTFGETIRSPQQDPEPRGSPPKMHPRTPDDSSTHYDFNRHSFVLESLNRNLDLYKLIHNELVDQNAKFNEQLQMIERIDKNIRDVIDNMIELNVEISYIKKNQEKSVESASSGSTTPRKSSVSAPRKGSISKPLSKSNSFKK